MQKYKYVAVNLQKQKIKGTFIAKDEKDLAAQLAKQSLYLVSAKNYSGNTPSAFFTLGTGKVSLKELTNFCRQFSIMLNTHIPILDCLDILKNQIEIFQPERGSYIIPQSLLKSTDIMTLSGCTIL